MTTFIKADSPFFFITSHSKIKQMKNVFSILAMGLLLMFASSNVSNAQTFTTLTSGPLLTGCVGACGSTYSGSFIAPATRKYKFSASSSLCPNTDAFVAILVNGTTVWSGQVVNGTEFKFVAPAGAAVDVLAGTAPNGSKILCIWLGEVNFSIF